MEQQIHSERVAYYDNAKFWAILLIVLGHFVYLPNDPKLNGPICNFLYVFHLPVFVVLAGMFSRNMLKKNRVGSYVLMNVVRVLIPFLIFHFAYSAVNHFYYYESKASFWQMNFFIPAHISWYLLSLFFWRLMLIVFSELKYALLLSLVVSLCFGYISNAEMFLSISRTIYFFPMFLLGYLYKDKIEMQVEKISIQKRLVAGTFLVVLLVLLLAAQNNVAWIWLTGMKSYVNTYGDFAYWGPIFRMTTYLVTILSVICFLLLIPRTVGTITAIGKKSLYIYLLHGFVISIFTKELFMDERFQRAMQAHPKSQVALFVLVSIVITLLLGSRLVIFVTKPFIEPHNVIQFFKKG
jgi:fucose 4-O-acetylase-like acetyltransferase